MWSEIQKTLRNSRRNVERQYRIQPGADNTGEVKYRLETIRKLEPIGNSMRQLCKLTKIQTPKPKILTAACRIHQQ